MKGIDYIRDVLEKRAISFPDNGDEWTCAVPAGHLRNATIEHGKLVERAIAAEQTSKIRLREIDRLGGLVYDKDSRIAELEAMCRERDTAGQKLLTDGIVDGKRIAELEKRPDTRNCISCGEIKLASSTGCKLCGSRATASNFKNDLIQSNRLLMKLKERIEELEAEVKNLKENDYYADVGRTIKDLDAESNT